MADEKPIGNFMHNQTISMRLTGIFSQHHTSSRMVRLLQPIYFIVGFGSMFHITVLLIATMPKMPSFEESAGLLSQLVVYILHPAQMLYFQYNARKCYDLMDYMNEHFVQRSARGLTYVTAAWSYRWGKNFTVLYIGFACVCTSQFLVGPVMSDERLMLIQTWYPIDETQTPYYQIIFTVQVISQAVIGFVFCNSLVFALGVSVNICGQFDILHCNLKNLEHTHALQRRPHISAAAARRLRHLQSKLVLDDGSLFPFSDERLDDLSDLPDGDGGDPSYVKPQISWENSRGANRLLHSYVRHHQHLIECADRLEDIIHPILLAKFLVVTVQLCILALNVLNIEHTTSDMMNDLMYLFAVSGDTFFNAHAGQILLDQSVRISDFMYTIPWYRMDRSLRQDMLLIQMHGCRPLQLTGGKFFVMDYEKFVAMIKLSFSYYTLLAEEEE